MNVEFDENGRTAELTQALELPKYNLTVPVGFKTDFASIPRFFWRILPPWDKHLPAAVAHDYMYRNGLRTRKEADKIFLSMMKELDVAAWKRNAMYWAVRMFGKSSYKA